MMSEELFKIDADVDAGEVLRAWVEKLKTLPRCVEIKEEAAQIWSIWYVHLILQCSCRTEMYSKSPRAYG